ncbi:MAG: CTB family bacteriocin [Rhizonema sp. PD38]|nr:CTB family bacteriocin [Rhizonema sp. PD38]
MKSNLFIAVSEEQQEVVVGGASNTNNTFFNTLKTLLATNLTFASATSSGKNGTTTGTTATFSRVNQTAAKNTGGASTTVAPDSIFG